MLIQKHKVTGEMRYWTDYERFNAKEWQTIGSSKGDPVVDEVIAKSSLQLGDLVEKAIKLLPESVRPEHCSKCEKRKQVLNRIRELGVVQALKELRNVS